MLVPARRHPVRRRRHELRGRVGRSPTGCCCACSTSDGAETRIPLPDRDGGVWHAFVPGVGAGQAYGYRATGPVRPGPRSPRATRPSCCSTPTPGRSAARSGSGRRCSATCPTTPTAPSTPRLGRPRAAEPGGGPGLRRGPREPTAPRRVRRHGHLRGPRQGLHRGATRTSPRSCAAPTPGSATRRPSPTCSTSASPPSSCSRCTRTCPRPFLAGPGPDQLLGLQHDRLLRAARRLLGRGPGRADPGGQVAEFKAMVDALHARRARGAARRGVQPHRRGRPRRPDAVLPRDSTTRRTTGSTRTTLAATSTRPAAATPSNAGDPLALQLIMDSLRYWLTEMRVDGFRFDLAPTLARQDGGFDRVSAFLDLVSQDPVVSRAKLIAEPWDVGQADSYDVGRFPPLWREWNGRYRDTMRDFWRSHGGLLGEFATRFTGSVRPVRRRRARPTASVNLITAHDGFTLRRPGLLRRQAQRGQRRGQPRRHRRQPLVELRSRGPHHRRRDPRPARPPEPGPAHHAAAVVRRPDDRSAATSSAAPSRATTTPTARTTRSPGSTGPAVDEELLEFTRRLVALRRAHPVFRRRRFLVGDGRRGAALVHPGRHADDRGRLAGPRARAASPSTSTAPMPPTGRTTAARCSTTTS